MVGNALETKEEGGGDGEKEERVLIGDYGYGEKSGGGVFNEERGGRSSHRP